jgi:hypothetical protein
MPGIVMTEIATSVTNGASGGNTSIRSTIDSVVAITGTAMATTIKGAIGIPMLRVTMIAGVTGTRTDIKSAGRLKVL